MMRPLLSRILRIRTAAETEAENALLRQAGKVLTEENERLAALHATDRCTIAHLNVTVRQLEMALDEMRARHQEEA